MVPYNQSTITPQHPILIIQAPFLELLGLRTFKKHGQGGISEVAAGLANEPVALPAVRKIRSCELSSRGDFFQGFGYERVLGSFWLLEGKG